MSKPGKKLTPQQREFYEHYLRLGGARGVGTQAAIAAQYSKKTAYSQANRLLKHAEGLKYLAFLKKQAADEAHKRGEATAEEQAKNRRVTAIKTTADRLLFYSEMIARGYEILQTETGPILDSHFQMLRSAMAAAKQMDALERGVAPEDEKFDKMMQDLKEGMTDHDGTSGGESEQPGEWSGERR